MSPDATKILADLARHRRCFDLTDYHLGSSLCKIATEGVQETLAAQQTPDGEPWPELSEEYARWKAEHRPGEPMGVLDRIMADPSEVEGAVVVTAITAEVTYGKTATARQHAEWFSVRRPFWGLTERSIAASAAKLDRRFEQIVG